LGNVDCDRAAGAGHERLLELVYVVEQAPVAWVTGRGRPKFVLVEGAALAGDNEVCGEGVTAVLADRTSTLGPAAVAVVSPATGRPSTLIRAPSRT
jgi:hypothetical protein